MEYIRLYNKNSCVSTCPKCLHTYRTSEQSFGDSSRDKTLFLSLCNEAKITKISNLSSFELKKKRRKETSYTIASYYSIRSDSRDTTRYTIFPAWNSAIHITEVSLLLIERCKKRKKIFQKVNYTNITNTLR